VAVSRAITADSPDAPVDAVVGNIGNPLAVRGPGRQTFQPGSGGQAALVGAVGLDQIEIPTAAGRALVDNLIGDRRPIRLSGFGLLE
jgi:hypothetical protein